MIWKFLVSGGWPMVPILFCSVVSLALLMERAWFWGVLWSNRDAKLRAALVTLSYDPQRAQRSRDPFCQVLFRMIREPQDPTAAVTLADRIVQETKSTLPMINVIAAVSTSLGLLGTVVGVALAFQKSAGNPSMAELVPALSVALNTTIFGLLVYMPAFVGASISQMATTKLAFQLEQGLNTVQAQLRRRAEGQS